MIKSQRYPMETIMNRGAWIMLVRSVRVQLKQEPPPALAAVRIGGKGREVGLTPINFLALRKWEYDSTPAGREAKRCAQASQPIEPPPELTPVSRIGSSSTNMAEYGVPCWKLASQTSAVSAIDTAASNISIFVCSGCHTAFCTSATLRTSHPVAQDIAVHDSKACSAAEHCAHPQGL
jgi:hypothetical protein